MIATHLVLQHQMITHIEFSRIWVAYKHCLSLLNIFFSSYAFSWMTNLLHISCLTMKITYEAK